MKNLKPITRQETLLAKVAGQDVSDLEPITREEFFLAKAAGQDVPTLEPITREEYFLADVIEAIEGGGGKLGEKSITENGTYNASDDSLDGYSKVTVDVSGGSGQEDDIINRRISGMYVNSTVSLVGTYAFTACNSLEGVSFPSVYFVGAYAFSSCGNLVSAYFPSMTTMYTGAFCSCSKLETFSAPLVGSIGDSTFLNCYKLTSVFAPSVTTIGVAAFRSCSALSSVSFPNVTSIALNAFANCSALASIQLPSVTHILGSAFASCYSLSTVTLFERTTNRSTYIYSNAFNNCSRLLSLYILNSLKVCSLSNINAFTNTPIKGTTTYTDGSLGCIFVPENLYEKYLSAANWSYYSSRFVSLTSEQIEHVKAYGTHVM